MREVFVRGGVAVLMAGAVLAGCGGSDKSESAPTTVAGSEPSRSGENTEQFCGLITTYGSRLAGLAQPTATADQIREFAEDLESAIKEALEVAPADIKADATVVAGAANSYLAALKKADYQLSNLPPADAQAFQAPDVAAAATRLQVYAQDLCTRRG